MKHTNIITKLEQMDRAALAGAWESRIGSPPPKASSRKFLLRALAYEAQARQNPTLSKSDLKVLSSALPRAKLPTPTEKTRTPKPRIKFIPGSRLVREWNGKTYTVSVIEEGFVYKDKIWSSLSAIAKDITSAHWSGPRFFGVTV